VCQVCVVLYGVGALRSSFQASHGTTARWSDTAYMKQKPLYGLLPTITVTFLALGTVLIDNFRYISDEGAIIREEKHIGGGGLFACAGARIWLLPDEIRVPVAGKKNGEIAEHLLKLSDGFENTWIWDGNGEMLEALIEYKDSKRR
jgi:hypothetical protein